MPPREFGKRPPAQPRHERPTFQATAEEAPTPSIDSSHMPKAILGIVLTVAVVGGMFVLPKTGQCDGRRGVFGLDWCRLMKASLEGAVRGVTAGRGAFVANGR